MRHATGAKNNAVFPKKSVKIAIVRFRREVIGPILRGSCLQTFTNTRNDHVLVASLKMKPYKADSVQMSFILGSLQLHVTFIIHILYKTT